MPTRQDRRKMYARVKGTNTWVPLAVNAAGEIEVVFDPSDVLHIQADQQITLNEVGIITTTGATWTGNVNNILDKDLATILNYTGVAGPVTITIPLKYPQKISGVAIRGTLANRPQGTIVTLQLLDGTTVNVYADVPGVMIQGLDVNFQPRMVRGIVISFQGLAVMSIDVAEVSIFKTIPVKSLEHDGQGNPITSTVVGADRGKDVHIITPPVAYDVAKDLFKHRIEEILRSFYIDAARPGVALAPAAILSGATRDGDGKDRISCVGVNTQVGTIQVVQYDITPIPEPPPADAYMSTWPVAAGVPFAHAVELVERYWKVRFVNGGVASTLILRSSQKAVY